MNQAISKRALIKQYVEQIDQLNAELAACREQNGVYLDPAQYERMKEDLESLTKEKEARNIQDAKLEEEMTSIKKLLDETQEQLEKTSAELGETKEELKVTQFVRKEGYEVRYFIFFNLNNFSKIRRICALGNKENASINDCNKPKTRSNSSTQKATF